ncbi:MAG: hypothetical protein JKX76_04575 [Colwellia sp.]|nr:hypothetical protein [Colwellia sp.]
MKVIADIRQFSFSLSLALALFSAEATAFSDNNDCLKQVKTIYDQLRNAPIDLNGKHTYYVDYSVRTVTRDSMESGPLDSRIQMWMQGESMRILSKEVEVYQDRKEVFTVMPLQKALVRTDKMLTSQNDHKKQNMALFQDTLFALSKVSYCESLKLNTGVGKRVVLQLSGEGRELLHIKSIVFDIDEAKRQIVKVRVNYADDYKSPRSPLSQIVYVEYIINHLDFQNNKKIDGPRVVSLFLESNGDLNERYRDYAYMDARYKSNKSILNQNGG